MAARVTWSGPDAVGAEICRSRDSRRPSAVLTDNAVQMMT